MLLGLGLAGSGAARAGEWSGDIGLELRAFAQDPLDARQSNQDYSVWLEPEFFHDWDDGRQRFAMTLFARADSADEERTHADVREFYWRRSFARAELFVGLRKIFWGVTESVHLVDIVNQTDAVENPDAEDKLGQPMAQLALIRDWGTLEVMLMPYFRERRFQGSGGRLRAPLPILADQPAWEADDEQRHLDVAVRWSHVLGDWDIGLAHFAGNAREPRLQPAVTPAGQLALRPHYELIDQTSIDLQATLGAWLWKLEAFSRRDQIERFLALAAGVEYTAYNLFGSGVDLGMIVEYVNDERGASATTAFQDDLVLGARLGFNDVQGSELLLLAGTDLSDDSRFASLEGSRRVGDAWRIALEARLFSNIDPANALFFLRDDDYLQLTLTRFF